MSDTVITPRPHVAERRALRHLVLNDLDDTSLHALTDPEPGSGAPAHDAGWRDLVAAVTHRPRRTTRTLVTGPAALERAVLDVVAPLCDGAGVWDGRASASAPDLLIGALPWRYEELGDVPDLPGPLTGPAPAVLPLAFTARTVTVGPVAGAGGACAGCVTPAYSSGTRRPDAALSPALFAFAAGAAGLFVRAFAAGNVTACSISLTFDMAAPHVEHRLWSCTPTCRDAA